MTINERIEILENTVLALSIRLGIVSQNTEGSRRKPDSIVGATKDHNINRPLLWNNTEINAALGTQPATPVVAYNKHSHSRFSGGALIKDVIEIVEYDWGSITNKHSQAYKELEIVKDQNTSGQSVDKIGVLDLVFNPDTLTWGTPAYEIDVKKCFLVERDSDGDIALDSKGNEKKSPLYNSDVTKSSIVWDENASCFRFYAVYSPGV